MSEMLDRQITKYLNLRNVTLKFSKNKVSYSYLFLFKAFKIVS